MAKGEKAEEAPDYSRYPKLVKSKFAELVEEQREIADMQKALKTRHDEIGPELCALMIAARADRVLVSGIRATLSKGRNSRISGQKLLQHGVSSTVIMECTDTQTYDYVSVRRVGEPEEDR